MSTATVPCPMMGVPGPSQGLRSTTMGSMNIWHWLIALVIVVVILRSRKWMGW
jgi:hypothetical protein